MVQGILIDLDDTLIDESSAVQSAVRHLRQSYPTLELETPEQAITRWLDLTKINWQRFRNGELTFQDQRRERIRSFFSHDYSDQEADDIFSCYLEAYENNWSPMPGTFEFIKQTEALPKAIVSNCEYNQTVKKLISINLHNCFMAVVTPELVGAAKPNHRIFQKAAELIGIEVSHCLMIGDDLKIDILPAQQLGMSVFHVVRDTINKSLINAIPAT